jgi:hypothetical protein
MENSFIFINNRLFYKNRNFLFYFSLQNQEIRININFNILFLKE